MTRPGKAQIMFGLLGTILGGYGAYLLWRQVHWTTGWLTNTGAYLFGGPVLHDAVLAPIVALAGLAIVRLVPTSWRATIATGLTATGVLALISVPLLWRPDPAQPNPGLQNRPYLTGLLIFLGVLWLGLILIHLVGTRRHRPRRTRR